MNIGYTPDAASVQGQPAADIKLLPYVLVQQNGVFLPC
jgi:hypothetical protein